MIASNHVQYDIVVLGGGPAGSMAALSALKESNGKLRICIVDPHVKSERHRIGEALLTGTIYALDALDLTDAIKEAGFHKKIGAAYRWGRGDDVWHVDYPAAGDGLNAFPKAFIGESGNKESIHVPRHIFDKKLIEIASDRGIDLIGGKAISYIKSRDHITVILNEGPAIDALHVIDATGQASLLGSAEGFRTPIFQNRGAKYGYIQNVDWQIASKHGFDIHRTNIVADKSGWFWMIHLGEIGNNLTSCGFVSNYEILKDLSSANAVDAFPALSLFGISGDLIVRDHYGTPKKDMTFYRNWSMANSKLHGERWSSCGDAALFLDPILSQGATLACHYGLMRGKAAAQSLTRVIPDLTDEHVDLHYRREASVLKEVISMWYDANNNRDGWRERATDIALREFGHTMPAAPAFQWVTNLENLRQEYAPFPDDVMHSLKVRFAA